MTTVKEINIIGKDTKDKRLCTFINKISIPLSVGKTTIQFWVETKDMLSIFDAFNHSTEKFIKEDATWKGSFIEMLCKGLDDHYKHTYKHIIIDKTINVCDKADYPESEILVLSMNWFLSLGYRVYKENNWDTQELKKLAKTYSFTYKEFHC
ncbi:hypothetical protein CN918_29520 [Priestia megaterium]|nr:hypothetical protein CN918_29520 [Priestia megaterium]